MPTAAIQTWSQGQLVPAYPQPAPEIDVALIASTTFAAGTILGELTATPGTYGPYASGNSDGTQNPKAILKYPCVTDSAGKVDLDGSGLSLQIIQPVYVGGFFRIEELTGLDANAVTKLGGAIVQGVVAGPGIFKF